MEYKKTLNLPQTDFPIRANLAKVEEEMLAKWGGEDIYHKILQKAESRKQNTGTYCTTARPTPTATFI